jgi:predicted nucleic acid-binding protein
MPNSIVLDSHALVAFLEAEPGHEVVAELFRRVADDELTLSISVVNLGEVWYHLARTHSEKDADDGIEELKRLGLQIVDADWPLTRQASLFKTRGGISFADCFAAALAKISKTAVLTGDPEFKRLEKEVDIQWLEEE